MVLYPDPLIILQLHDGVFPEGDGSHGMEKFGAFTTKFNSIFSISILPVCVH